MCWLLSAVGVVCILVAHEHYSVDVVVGYFVTTRLFWWYHSMANRQVGVTSRQLVCYLVTWNVLVHYYFFPMLAFTILFSPCAQCECSPNNYFTNTWWNPLFNFMERNVNTPVPRVYGWPISWAPACLKTPCKKYSMVQSTRDEWQTQGRVGGGGAAVFNRQTCQGG